MLARVFAIRTCLFVRPSVCLSRAVIVSKRFLHHLVAGPMILVPPELGPQTRVGWENSAIF